LIKLFVLVAFSQFPLLNPVTSGRGGLFRRESESDVNAFPLNMALSRRRELHDIAD